MELIAELKNPFENLTKDNKQAIQEKCKGIATELFSNYCILCKTKKYYFAEVEFYYWQKDKFEENWNKVTYCRKGYSAGNLFYHLSGLDICFDCEKERYGGILVRSIIDGNGVLTIGPLTCKNIILNECGGLSMPRLSPTATRNCDVKPTFRYLGETDFEKINKGEANKDGNLKLAFFDKNIEKSQWDKSRPSYYDRLIKFI